MTDDQCPANAAWIMDTATGKRTGRSVGRSVGRLAAAETMAASQRRSQPIGVALGDDVE